MTWSWKDVYPGTRIVTLVETGRFADKAKVTTVGIPVNRLTAHCTIKFNQLPSPNLADIRQL